MREDAKLQAELLDRDIAAAKDHVEQYAHDKIPSTRHADSKSVEFNRLADDILLNTKRKWAREGKTVHSDTPYNQKDFREQGKVEIEQAEKMHRSGGSMEITPPLLCSGGYLCVRRADL